MLAEMYTETSAHGNSSHGTHADSTNSVLLAHQLSL